MPCMLVPSYRYIPANDSLALSGLAMLNTWRACIVTQIHIQVKPYLTACEDLPDIYDQHSALEVLVRYLTFSEQNGLIRIWKIFCWLDEMSTHIKDDLRTNHMFRYCWSFKYYSNLRYIHICIFYTCTYNYFEISLHYCK